MKDGYQKLIPTLVKGNVKFIIIGGVAAVVHGSARATFDLDVVYSRNSDNIIHLVQTLKPYSPYLRDAPGGLPFVFDRETVQMPSSPFYSFTLNLTPYTYLLLPSPASSSRGGGLSPPANAGNLGPNKLTEIFGRG
jgi:hypothetical protein